MKTRRLLAPILGFIACVTIYSCGIKWNNSQMMGDTICSNYSDLPGTLEVKLIHEMTNKYEQKQLAAINAAHGRSFIASPNSSDARAIKFDLETLKKFIYHIETQAKATNKSIDAKNLGVRIYYGTYPNPKTFNDYTNLNNQVSLKFAEYHTLVMIPTISIDGEDLDFNPLDKDTYDSGLKENPERYGDQNTGGNNNLSTQTMALLLSNDPSTSSQNHGNLYPPLGEGGLNF